MDKGCKLEVWQFEFWTMNAAMFLITYQSITHNHTTFFQLT